MINKDMLIADIVDNYPTLVPFIMDYGVHCIGCGISMFETFGEGFSGHGYTEDEIEKAIEDLNKILKEMPKAAEQSNL